MTVTVERKDFLRILTIAGAGLTLASSWHRASLRPQPASRPSQHHRCGPSRNAAFTPVAWVEMGTDGINTVVINQTELGQGITTALTMCVAEELDVPMSAMRFRMSTAEPKYYNARWHGIQTGGSQSTPSMSPVMRNAGATARAMIVTAAAASGASTPHVHHVERYGLRAGRTEGEVR